MDYLDHYVLRQRKYSILEYLYNPNHRLGSSFNRLMYTHPAIFMVEFSLSKYLEEESEIEPDYVIGTSMGSLCLWQSQMWWM